MNYSFQFILFKTIKKGISANPSFFYSMVSEFFIPVSYGFSSIFDFCFFKYFFFILAFILASRQDFQSRLVSDSIWFCLIFFLFPVIAAEIFVLGVSHFFDIAVSVCLVFIFAAVCFYFRIFGGADGKAFLLIAAAFPIEFSALFFNHPESDSQFYFLLFGFAVLFSSFFISVLMNSLLLSLIFVLIRAGIILFFQKNNQSIQSISAPVPFFIPLTGGFLAAALFGNLIYQGLLFIFRMNSILRF